MATTLARGDIAVIEFTVSPGPAGDTSGFGFVLLSDIDASTVIRFTTTSFNTAGQVVNSGVTLPGPPGNR